MNKLNVILQKFRVPTLYLLIGVALFAGGQWMEDYLLQEGNDFYLIKRFEKIFNKKEKYLDKIIDQVVRDENADMEIFTQTLLMVDILIKKVKVVL